MGSRARLLGLALVVVMSALLAGAPAPPASTTTPIDVRYAQLGGAASVYGAPLGAEYAVAGGRARRYEGGMIFWSSATGARAVRGPLLRAYLAAGGPASDLGLPTSEIHAAWQGQRFDVQRGSIHLRTSDGRTTVWRGRVRHLTNGERRRMIGSSWRSGCPVHLDNLRMIQAEHRDFAGGRSTGQLVVHVDQARKMWRVLRDLHEQGFRIERMRMVDDYGASDARSMAANNTSAFNCRRIAGTTRWSEHAYGRAIDVNPVQNPWVSSSGRVEPTAGRAYLDRSKVRPGMIVAGDPTVKAFARIGWSWGGAWTSSKDYQHFSSTGR